jgi:hypothetical protein
MVLRAGCWRRAGDKDSSSLSSVFAGDAGDRDDDVSFSFSASPPRDFDFVSRDSRRPNTRPMMPDM